MHDKVIIRTRLCVPIYSNCDYMKLQNDSVTLTFETGTWFLDATHCLDMVDICAKLFQNPSMYDKVAVRTRMNGQTDGAIILCLPFGGIKMSGRVHVIVYYPSHAPTAICKYLSVRRFLYVYTISISYIIVCTCIWGKLVPHLI
jgi:hypothetical protein